ncbi:MAG: extracellular solute-binding protein [Actinobacteria bacterium]|nr:extracellular solute-binding protein [Actinomycetota bacterium]
MNRRALSLSPIAGLLAALVLTACGSGGGNTSEAVAPSKAELEKPATGTLRVFAYEDSIVPALIKPFEEENPGLTVKTASFGSDAEAAAKLVGGFQADVVQICMDEAPPLLEQNLIRPIDTAGVKEWDNLIFHDSEAVRHDGKVFMAPLSAGFHGLIVNTEKVPEGVDSFGDLYDPKFKGKVALEGDYPLPPVATTALAIGIKDPMNMTPAQIERVGKYMNEHRDQFRTLTQTESDTVNLFRTGEVVLADGDSNSTAKVLREAGVPAKSVVPKEGGLSWVCGYGLSAKEANTDAAYRFINYSASPKAQAILGERGYTVANPKAMPLVPAADKETADPAVLKHAIPETHPPHYDMWTRVLQEFQAGG